MLKVFLVEDEFVVREGIKNNINWEEEGYCFCGEASDGELASPMIELHKPDIIITDICMPFMDGLELSHLVKKSLPDAKIIVLSGYGEFEYAQRAINIGIEEYLLKPINKEELLEVLNKVREKIIKEKEEKNSIEKFRQEMRENTAEAKLQLFYDMVRNTKPLSAILEKGNSLSLYLSALYYNVILLKVQCKDKEEEYSKRIVGLYSEIEKLVEDSTKINLFDRNLEGIALLIKGETPEELMEIQNYYIHKLKTLIEGYKGITYFGGIGEPVDRLRKLEHSFDEASRAFAYRFLSDESQFLDCHDISKIKEQEHDEFHMGMVDATQLDKEKAASFLRRGEISEISYFIEEYLRNLGSAGTESVIFRQYIIMDLYFIVTKFLEELKVPLLKEKAPFDNPAMMKQILSNIEVSKKYLIQLFKEAMEKRNEISNKRYADIVDMAKQYIEDNYSNDEISLNTAASFVNISPSHLSAVFSQEMGQTFIKYLTSYRMTKAMELLRCTNKRSNEVSLAVGYKDPHYFSYLFKKNQGVTPMQYRMEGGQYEKEPD